MYCSNCGQKIDEESSFCSGCGKRIKLKDNIKSPESKTKDSEPGIPVSGEHNSTKKLIFSGSSKTPAHRHILKNIWILALICILGILFTAYSTFALSSDQYSVNSLKSQDRIQTDKNIRLCEQIANEYRSSHIYSKDDIYDCDNMAQDVWNMLKAKGINARISVGSFESAGNGRIANETDLHRVPSSGSLGEIEIPNRNYASLNLSNSSSIENFNHAWVLAEVSPDSWLAIECTGGYIVYSDENEKYYQGLTFSNPKNYRSFLFLYRDWKIKSLDYESEKAYYNERIKSYNDASSSEQITMESGIEVAQRTLYEKEHAFLKTDSELNALMRYG